MCLEHIFMFVYYPPEKESDYEDNTIFIRMRSLNLYSEIIPSIYYYLWDEYFRFNYLKRFGIIFKYLFKIPFSEDNSIFDSFNFQVKDLSNIYEFLLNYENAYGHLLNNEKERYSSSKTKQDKIEIEDYHKKYKILIKVHKEEAGDKLTIGYDFGFCDGNIWKRLKTSFDYMFFSRHNEEKEFEIKKIDDIINLKSMIENTFISDLGILNIIEDVANDMIEDIEE